MNRLLRIPVVLSLLILATVAAARPRVERVDTVSDDVNVDRIGNVDGTAPLARKTAVDTTWIADWTFDGAGGVCDDSGWQRMDGRVREDRSVFWDSDDNRFDGMGGITGEAAVLSHHDLCWGSPDGYDNGWYLAVRIEYAGASFLSFDYVLDATDAGYDFLQVEIDERCESRDLDIRATGGRYRTVPFSDTGVNPSGRIDSLPLDDFGDPLATHCVYVAFTTDSWFSPADGQVPSTFGIATAVDNIELSGATSLTENFEGAGTTHPAISFIDFWHDAPFGDWARVYKYATDNDLCTENTTCAWLFTDNTTPTIANDPTMAFGPEGLVIRSWLDDIIVSPWVSLASTGDAQGTILTFQELGGNPFASSKIVRNWGVRSKTRVDNSDTPAPGDSIDCICRVPGGGSAWGNFFRWNTIDSFEWRTHEFDMSRFIDTSCAEEIQIRFKVSDWQLVNNDDVPPSPFVPGPGPYIDRVRVGRRAVTGPVFDESIDSRTQAQDAFPTEIHPFVTPAGEHHRPQTSSHPRFGTAAFSLGGDLGSEFTGSSSPNLITGDSIKVRVLDARGAGGIASVAVHGAIVSGPHAGKAPPPWSVGANGFFVVPAEPSQYPDGTVATGHWFVDLDDDYFRGGDVLVYYWFAQDSQGGAASHPEGLSADPNSIRDAETLTGGLFEVSFLPKIDWDPGYLGRIAADPHGKVEPTEGELANSNQTNCILYYQLGNSRRMSGDANRTSFMYTLDRLGYRGHYDVYDVQGTVATNNHLGGRATVEQATGYALIIQDSGQRGPGRSLLPDGTGIDDNKVDQVGWYRDWLANATLSDVGTATLWLIGARLVETANDNPLLVADMGVELVSSDVLPVLGANPDVGGQTSFTFANSNAVDFSNDQFTAQAACPDFPPYNGLGASGTAAVTHRWKNGAALGDGAIVMNANPTQFWNTIMQVPTWHEIRDSESTPTSPGPEEQLMTQILNGVLLPECIQNPDPTTDVGDERDQLNNLPKVTALYQNAPNPFNPVTTIRFDLARDGHVDLRVYDVTGRLVRNLIDESMTSERHKLVWDGLDDAGVSVSSGIYFYRLETTDFRDTHKMVVLR